MRPPLIYIAAAAAAVAAAGVLALSTCVPMAAAADVCPSWPVHTAPIHSNQPSPYLGCANATNLQNSVDKPGDLVKGRPLGPANGEREGRAVETYEQGRVRPFQSVNPPTPSFLTPGTMGTGAQ